MLVGRIARRSAAGDDGTIAVLAAVVIPVILLVIALALSTIVWGASETEVQRASDQAAVQAAATALLADFPYASVDTLTNSNNITTLYPTLQSVTGTTMAPPTLGPCATLGDPLLSSVASTIPTVTTTVTPVTTVIGGIVTVIGTTTSTTSTLTPVNSGLSTLDAATTATLTSLPANCSSLIGPFAPIPAIPDTALVNGCDAASANVTDPTAPYATRFFNGQQPDAQPNCDVNKRVQVQPTSDSPLLGLPGTGVGVGATTMTVPSGFDTVQQTLAGLGIHLDTALPNLVCPQISVRVDQPVKGPLFSEISVPNGRSTARRVIKNAVVVPIFNGVHLPSDTGVAVPGAGGQVTVSGGVSTSPYNLNAMLLQKLQKRLLADLDKLNTVINNRLAAANATVQKLSGIYNRVDGKTGNALPGETASVGNLDLLQCVRQTVADIYDPPSGSAATVDDVLKQAAKDGEPVQVIQLGVTSCAGAVATTDALSCVDAATGSASGAAAAAAGAVTGLYDIPFLDVTPTMIKDIGGGNYEAVPVHASQAAGAFRATLVRASADNRFAP